MRCRTVNATFEGMTQAAQISLLFEAIVAMQRDIRTVMTNQQILSQQVEDLGRSFGLIEAFLTSLESRLIDAQEHIAELTEDVAESQVDLAPLIAKVTEVKNFAAGLNPESPTPPAENPPAPEIPAPGEETPAPEPDPEPEPEP